VLRLRGAAPSLTDAHAGAAEQAHQKAVKGSPSETDQLLDLFGGQPLIALHGDPKPDRSRVDGSERQMFGRANFDLLRKRVLLAG
jgi:hypothetical protein